MKRKGKVYCYAIRRTKRKEKLHRAKALLEAARIGDMNLLREMKRVVNGNGLAEELSEVVDGVTGHGKIAERFREIHEELYNSQRVMIGLTRF